MVYSSNQTIFFLYKHLTFCSNIASRMWTGRLSSLYLQVDINVNEDGTDEHDFANKIISQI